MSYGVNTLWAAPHGRARAAGSSKARSTRTAKRKKASSARRARKRSSATGSRSRRTSGGSKRRSLHQDYHAEAAGKKPQDWGGTLAEWYAYRNDKTGTVPGKWL